MDMIVQKNHLHDGFQTSIKLSILIKHCMDQVTQCNAYVQAELDGIGQAV